MEIEGLVCRKRKGGAVFLSPRAGGRRGIAVRPRSVGAVVEVQEDGKCPGLANGESVSLPSWDEAVIDRVVRALAVLHLGVGEASVHGTEADVEFVSRGFLVGRSPAGKPVWIMPGPGFITAVSKDEEGGLPALMSEPATLVFTGAAGAKVVVKGENLATVVSLFDSGRVPGLYNPAGDVIVEGALDRKTVTVH